MRLKNIAGYITFLFLLLTAQAAGKDLCSLKSPDGLNAIYVSLDNRGQPSYRIERRGHAVIHDSPLGLRCDDQDFSQAMTQYEIDQTELGSESYQLVVGNTLKVEKSFARTHLTFKNAKDLLLTIDLAASNDGIGFRYRFNDGPESKHKVVEELTGFRVPPAATGWLQPYHQAGPYTPAYEDFYYRVKPGDLPSEFREKPRGWCLPGLFHITPVNMWMLIAETGTDGSYCACHLNVDKFSKNLYTIAFAYEDEVTAAKSFDANAKPAAVLTRATPWRIVIMGDKAADILCSTMVTDLASPSQITDASWIKPGRASWSWWSNPEGHTAELYDSFTDLAASYGWEYTLFDAGWWNTDLEAISRYANAKGVKPLVWAHAVDFYDTEKRKRKLDDWVGKGIKGIKVDFWCSDSQETMAAMQATLKDAAERKLVVSFHGCTIPRGWHRTWPNLLTAEAVLGTECYFCEPRYPARAAEFNTILPFTRNVLGPMDTTPVALTIKEFPRRTTAAHELATSIVFTSGIIHYADSVEVLNGLPSAVKQVLRRAPAAWDETRCLVGDPGRVVVLARRTGKEWFVAGLNGTDKPLPVAVDLKQLSTFAEFAAITEGKDPLMQFSVRTNTDISKWRHQIPPFGGFVLALKPAK
jgi:alpha-glucosidase